MVMKEIIFPLREIYTPPFLYTKIRPISLSTNSRGVPEALCMHAAQSDHSIFLLSFEGHLSFFFPFFLRFTFLD
jgi:hypothetical protein